MKDWIEWFKQAPRNTQVLISFLLFAGFAVVLISVISIGIIMKAQFSTSNTIAESKVHHSETNEETKPTVTSFPYELNQVSMAVMSKKGTKTAYAQFTLSLDCPSEESQKLMALNRAKLLDSVFLVGSNFYLDDFTAEAAPKSLEKFKHELLEKYQEHFQAEAPRGIVLKEWFIN